MCLRIGKRRPSERSQSQTLRTDPSSLNFAKIVWMAPTTASSGWKRTSPSPSPHTKPTGKLRRNSPRAALLRIPPSSRAQDVQFCLRHDVFQAENQAIVEKRRMIDVVAISHQSIGHAAQIEPAIPVGMVACQTGDFQTDYDSRAAHSNFGGQVREAGALDPSRTRPAQIFIDDDHLFSGPAQLADFFHQIILASGGLAVVFDLCGAGLTDVDIGGALDMVGFYFARIIHGCSPPPDYVEQFGR